MSIKYYQLAKGEELPEEFCAVRDIGGEPSEYVFYEPEGENTKLFALLKHESEQTEKLRELVRDMGELLDVLTECDLACKHYHRGCIGDCYYVNTRRELGVEV